jgi:hypothetical protein
MVHHAGYPHVDQETDPCYASTGPNHQYDLCIDVAGDICNSAVG